MHVLRAGGQVRPLYLRAVPRIDLSTFTVTDEFLLILIRSDSATAQAAKMKRSRVKRNANSGRSLVPVQNKRTFQDRSILISLHVAPHPAPAAIAQTVRISL